MVVAVSNVAMKFRGILKRINLEVNARLSDSLGSKVHDTKKDVCRDVTTSNPVKLRQYFGGTRYFHKVVSS